MPHSETVPSLETALSFSSLPLAAFLQETIRSVGYETPTPIQSQAIPVVVEGRDLIGLAQTGTGKTAAFVLPLINRLTAEKKTGTRALILAPTRELAEQINDVLKLFLPRTGLRSCTVYGGVSHRAQINALRSSPAIVVACPGRLKDHMQGRTINLSGIEMLVLDEADRMLDMGFMPDIRHIVKALPKEGRQTLLFSATMPEEIEMLSQELLRDPFVVRVKTESPVATVSHGMYGVGREDKGDQLNAWLAENPEALAVVFTKMKHTAKKLGTKLSDAGIDATSLHGNLTQAARLRALSGFREGRFRVLIATDIAARGIDVEGITHVVNFDMPDTLDSYIHRTGRAGRASRTGEAVSFVTRADLPLLRQIEKWLAAPMARLGGDGFESAGRARSSEDRPSRTRQQGGARGGSFRREGRAGGERSFGERGGRGQRFSRDRDERRERRTDSPAGPGERRERFPRDEQRSFERRDGAPRGERRDGEFRRGRPGTGEGRQPREGGFQRGRPAEGRVGSAEGRQPREGGFQRGRSAEGRGGSTEGRQPREGGFQRGRTTEGRGGSAEGRQPREGRFQRDNNSGGRRSAGTRGPGRPTRPFRGQQDIDPNSPHVYREPGSQVAGQSTRGEGRRGGRSEGSRFERGSHRGPRRTSYE